MREFMSKYKTKIAGALSGFMIAGLLANPIYNSITDKIQSDMANYKKPATGQMLKAKFVNRSVLENIIADIGPSKAFAQESAYAGQEMAVHDYESMAQQMEKMNTEGLYEQVIEQFKEYADDKGNKSALFYNEFGGAKIVLKKYEEAIPDLEKAVSLSPRDSIMWKNLGNAFYYSGQKNNAINAYEKYANLLPDGPQKEKTLSWIKKNK